MTVAIVVLLVVIVALVFACATLHKRLGPIYAATWRRMGRHWATDGEMERAQWCHDYADFFELPWWQALMCGFPTAPPPPLRGNKR